jgi:hypothetical protein
MAISEEAHELRMQWLESNRDSSPSEWIELTEEGFIVKRRRFFWPFKPKQHLIEWKDVKEIYAAINDCYSCHPMFLYFIRDGVKDLVVDELMGNYIQLFERVLQIFQDFDKDMYYEVEGYFPGEGCQLCWKTK